MTDYFGNNFSTAKRSIGAVEYAGNVDVEELFDKENFSLFPNPCSNELNILFNNQPYNIRIEIYNSIGQVVCSLKPLTNLFQINTTSWTKGIYHIIVMEESVTIHSRSFVVE